MNRIRSKGVYLVDFSVAAPDEDEILDVHGTCTHGSGAWREKTSRGGERGGAPTGGPQPEASSHHHIRQPTQRFLPSSVAARNSQRASS